MRAWVVGYRLSFAILTVAAIVVQFAGRAQTSSFNAVNFFSFFTIESNIFAAVILAVSALAVAFRKEIKGLSMLRGAATLYMVTTGIVYTLLLSGNEVALQTTIPWVNVVLHYILPVVMFLDWVIAPPTRRIALSSMLWWLAFPVVYIVYCLVRGPYADWYPYPFVDPRPHGYLAVAAYSGVIAVAIIVIAIVIRLLGNYNLKKDLQATVKN